FNRPFEPKVGINFRNVESSFQGVGHLETNSIGLFGEATVFPFRKYFFAGVRWELITLNWLTSNAMKELNSNLSSITFSGTNLYGTVGIDIPVFNKIGFRLYGMPGIKNYTVSDGSFSSGSYVSDGTVQESHTEFVYQINAAVVIHLK
ncbi:MAG: hypothetical protein LBQ22_07680, partial [Bacteroidales bacterium]|nr:hypothetical protein [Bacteroidales bacterium]